LSQAILLYHTLYIKIVTPRIAWPVARPHIDPAEWTAFKILMEAFYEKGLRSGLPDALLEPDRLAAWATELSDL